MTTTYLTDDIKGLMEGMNHGERSRDQRGDDEEARKSQTL